VLACAASVALSACGDCEKAAAEAEAFLADEANQRCQSDADCVVVHTGCASVKGSYCGQVGLNRTAAKSEAWQELSEFDGCADSCTQCAAALVVQCGDNGLCWEP
jgi:hypothetical protein